MDQHLSRQIEQASAGSTDGTPDWDVLLKLVSTRYEELEHARQLGERALDLMSQQLAGERRFRQLFEQAAQLMVMLKPNGDILEINENALSLSGQTRADVVGRPLWLAGWLSRLPEGRFRLKRAVADAARGEFVQVGFLVIDPDGHEKTIELSLKPIVDDRGEISSLVAEGRDASGSARTEQELFEEKERAQVTLDSISDAVITCDASGRIAYMNPRAAQLTGWESHEAVGNAIDTVFTTDESEHPLLRCLREGRVVPVTDDATLIDRNRTATPMQYSIAPIRSRSGVVTGAVAVFHDASRERSLRRQLSYQANHDTLTSLLNRCSFEHRLQLEIDNRRASSAGTDALLYIDLDQFKIVNDTCGHVAGDELLKQLTAVLKNNVRTTDVLARLGGDEFAVLLSDCHGERAHDIAEKVRKAIGSFRFIWSSGSFSVSCSIGIVEIDDQFETATEVLSAADVACYVAKDAGRNRLHLYRGSDASDRHREMRWVSRVTRAYEENRLELFHQPIVAVAKGVDTTPHHELLLRMRDENGDYVSPGLFIPAAERYNLMPTIDRWTIDTALREFVCARPVFESGSGYVLAINLSGTSLSDDSFLDYVVRKLDTKDFAPGSLCFEITETAAINNRNKVARFMHAVRDMGCRFSLDDFGSGLSSFAYLKDMPVDYLKIDGYFIRNVVQDPVDESVVRAIVEVARAIGIATVAECIENSEMLDCVTRLGVDFAQGFHFARPGPIRSRAQLQQLPDLPALVG